MNQAARQMQANEAERDRPDIITPVRDSAVLMNGRRELIIRHGRETYRLRVTASNKLILTK
jgi:hemin uptake protein HemP